MISILLPTRHRPELLLETVDSIIKTADNPDNVEILIRCDNDDSATLNIRDQLELRKNTKLIAGERFRGFQDVWKYLLELGELAKGDLLMSFADDYRMITKGWDRMLEGYLNRMCILKFPTADALRHMVIAFGLHRGIFELLGHISLNAHADTWMEFVGHDSGVFIETDVVIDHLRDKIAPDELYREVREVLHITNPEFHSPAMVTARDRDIKMIRRYISLFGDIYNRENVLKVKEEFAN